MSDDQCQFFSQYTLHDQKSWLLSLISPRLHFLAIAFLTLLLYTVQERLGGGALGTRLTSQVKSSSLSIAGKYISHLLMVHIPHYKP